MAAAEANRAENMAVATRSTVHSRRSRYPPGTRWSTRLAVHRHSSHHWPKTACQRTRCCTCKQAQLVTEAVMEVLTEVLTEAVPWAASGRAVEGVILMAVKATKVIL